MDRLKHSSQSSVLFSPPPSLSGRFLAFFLRRNLFVFSVLLKVNAPRGDDTLKRRQVGREHAGNTHEQTREERMHMLMVHGRLLFLLFSPFSFPRMVGLGFGASRPQLRLVALAVCMCLAITATSGHDCQQLGFTDGLQCTECEKLAQHVQDERQA